MVVVTEGNHHHIIALAEDAGLRPPPEAVPTQDRSRADLTIGPMRLRGRFCFSVEHPPSSIIIVFDFAGVHPHQTMFAYYRMFCTCCNRWRSPIVGEYYPVLGCSKCLIVTRDSQLLSQLGQRLRQNVLKYC